MSRPTRARGLKQTFEEAKDMANKVAPHAGAWIETSGRPSRQPGSWSRPTRARGLKPCRVYFVL